MKCWYPGKDNFDNLENEENGDRANGESNTTACLLAKLYRKVAKKNHPNYYQFCYCDRLFYFLKNNQSSCEFVFIIDAIAIFF